MALQRDPVEAEVQFHKVHLGGIFSFKTIAKEITEQSPWNNWCHLTLTCTLVDLLQV